MIFFVAALLVIIPAWRDKRLAGLVVAYALIVGLSVLVLPAYVGTGMMRYSAAGSFELVIVLTCLIVRHPAGIALALLSLIAMEWHWLASTDYAAGIKGVYWHGYKPAMLKIQWGQILALFLFTPPVVNVIELALRRITKKWTETKWTARTLPY